MYRHVIAIMLFAAVLSPRLDAQTRSRSEDVLRPAFVKLRLGGFLGSQLNLALGSYTTTCDCRYSDGTGFGMTGGAVLDIPVANRVALVAEVSYQNQFASSSRAETRLEYLRASGSYVPADVESTSDVSLSYLVLHAAAKWMSGPGRVFVTLGPAFGMRIGNHIVENERIVTPGLAYDDTGLREKTFLDGDLSTAFASSNRIFCSVEAGLGYEFHIAPAWYVLPQLRYSYPLTSVTSAHPEWKIASLRLMIHLEAAL